MSKPLHDHEFVGTCVNNPFDDVATLIEIVDNSISISKRTFLEHCCVLKAIQKDMHQFPNDFHYYRARLRGHYVYYFENSRIETFYMKGVMK